jgi:hypothetical protein
MAVAWVSSTASTPTTSTTTCTVTLPTTAADDILIVTVNNGGANAAPTLTTGTFTLDTSLALIGSGGGWTTGWGGTYWVRCTGNHSGQTIILTGATDSCSMQVQRFSGCITTGNPYDTNISEATVAAGANCALAAFSTTVTNTLVCYAVSRDDNIAATTPTKGGAAMGNLLDATSSGGADSGSAMASLAQAGTGTTGAFSMTFAAGTNTGKRATAFALKPPTAVGHTQPVDDAIAGTDAEVASAAKAQADAIAGGDVQAAAIASLQADAATVTDAIDPQLTVGEFSPPDIAGLECWLKADAIGLADGANVTTWEDSHTSNKDATNSTGQTLETNEINGLPVVRFDGTDDRLLVSGITNNDATRTFFFVGRTVSHAVNDAFWGFGSSSVLNMTGAGAVRWGFNEAAAQVNIDLTGGAGTVRVITLRFNGTSSADAYSLDGAAINFDPADQYQATGTTLVLGARGVTAYGNVEIGEFLVYDSALSDTDLDDIRSYLLERWIGAAGHSQPVDDAAAVTDAQAKTVTRPQADAIVGTDAQAKAATHPQADTATATDAQAKSVTGSKADAIAATDAAARGVTATKADTITGTDARTATWAAARSQPDTIAGTDAQAKASTHPLADTAAATDARASSVSHALADPIAGTDAATRRVGSARADTIAGTDTRASASAKALADTIAGTDAQARVWAAKLTIADGISATDDVDTSAAGANEEDIDDSVTITDAISVSVGARWTIGDSLAATDALITQADYVRQPVDALAVTDALERAWTIFEAQDDALTVTDAVDARIPPARWPPDTDEDWLAEAEQDWEAQTDDRWLVSAESRW